MAIFSGKDPFWTAKRGIVQNGLVLNLDAAVPQSYPGTGTIWRDLSGRNNNGTLINGSIYDRGNGGGIMFNGGNYVNASPSFNTSNFSFNIVVRPNDINSGRTLVQLRISSGHIVLVFGIGMWVTGGKLAIAEGGGGFPGSISSTSGILQSAWSHIAITKQSDNLFTFYINGIASGSGYFSSSEQIANTYIGGDFILPSYYTLFNGNISQFLLYNRTLSASEIAQNYNATRRRFGV